MRWQKMLQLADVHCEGEIGKVVTGGVLGIPGTTMLDKMNYINQVDDSLRRFVIFEPRGCLQMSVNVLLPPTRPEADAGFIILQADRAHPMSGSNCICVVTALLELGILPIQTPQTKVVLDTPAGLVTAIADCSDGRCVQVSLDMPAAFVTHLDLAINSQHFGAIKTDIAFGGCWYALIDAAAMGLSITPQNARKLAEAGALLREEISRAVRLVHPTEPSLNQLAYVMFRQKIDDANWKTCTAMPPGRCDRSPCGTGSSANLATLAARGYVKSGDTLTSHSITGGQFSVHLRANTHIAHQAAILPRITGRGFVYGFSQLGVDPNDPLAAGHMLSDTWGEGFIDD